MSLTLLEHVEGARRGVPVTRQLLALRPSRLLLDARGMSGRQLICARTVAAALARLLPEAHLSSPRSSLASRLWADAFAVDGGGRDGDSLLVRLAPRARRAQLTELTSGSWRLTVPGRPWLVARAHPADRWTFGARLAGLPAAVAGPLRLPWSSRRQGARWVREHVGRRAPVVLVLPSRRLGSVLEQVAREVARWCQAQMVVLRPRDDRSLADVRVALSVAACSAVCLGADNGWAHAAAAAGAHVVTMHDRSPVTHAPRAPGAQGVRAGDPAAVQAACRLAAQRWPRDHLLRLLG